MDPVDGPSFRIAVLTVLALLVWLLPAGFGRWVGLLFVVIALCRAGAAWYTATRPGGHR